MRVTPVREDDTRSWSTSSSRSFIHIYIFIYICIYNIYKSQTHTHIHTHTRAHNDTPGHRFYRYSSLSFSFSRSLSISLSLFLFLSARDRVAFARYRLRTNLQKKGNKFPETGTRCTSYNPIDSRASVSTVKRLRAFFPFRSFSTPLLRCITLSLDPFLSFGKEHATTLVDFLGPCSRSLTRRCSPLYVHPSFLRVCLTSYASNCWYTRSLPFSTSATKLDATRRAR